MRVSGLAVDANILVAAMMGGRTRDLMVGLRRAGIELVAAEEAFAEVEEHLPALARYARAGEDRFRLALWSMPVERVSTNTYVHCVERAGTLMKNRDPDDTPTAALAMAREIPVWSNDKDFAGLKGIAVFTTADVVGMLGRG